jgi:hypothetical protein
MSRPRSEAIKNIWRVEIDGVDQAAVGRQAQLHDRLRQRPQEEHEHDAKRDPAPAIPAALVARSVVA